MATITLDAVVDGDFSTGSGVFAIEERSYAIDSSVDPPVLTVAIDDGEPQNADLRLADAGISPKCDPRYDSFIDHVVLDKRAGADMLAFAETLYAPGEKHYSDHCPVMVTLAR